MGRVFELLFFLKAVLFRVSGVKIRKVLNDSPVFLSDRIYAALNNVDVVLPIVCT